MNHREALSIEFISVRTVNAISHVPFSLTRAFAPCDRQAGKGSGEAVGRPFVLEETGISYQSASS